MLVYVLKSATIWLLETLLNQNSKVGKKKAIYSKSQLLFVQLMTLPIECSHTASQAFLPTLGRIALSWWMSLHLWSRQTGKGWRWSGWWFSKSQQKAADRSSCLLWQLLLVYRIQQNGRDQILFECPQPSVLPMFCLCVSWTVRQKYRSLTGLITAIRGLKHLLSSLFASTFASRAVSSTQ